MQRSFGLDILRTIAIFFVVICHSVYILYPILPEFVGNVLMKYGALGVDLFFVLSGFLIGRIFLKEVLCAAEDSKHENIKRFWRRRWFRTLPNYYLFLCIHVVLVYLGYGKDQSGHTAYILLEPPLNSLIKFPFFLHNFIDVYPGFFAQSWSLSVEEWFYILLPFLFLGYLKLGAKKVAKNICRYLLIVFIFMLVWKWFSYYVYPNFYFAGKVVFNFDQILIGVLLAAIYNFYEQKFNALRKTGLILGLLCFILANFIMIKFVIVADPIFGSDLWMRLVFTIGFACLIFFCADYTIKPSQFTKLILIISQASYSIYLSHMLILLFLVDRFLLKVAIMEQTSLGRITIFIVFNLVTVFVSHIIFTKYEKPIMALRDKSIFSKKPQNIVH